MRPVRTKISNHKAKNFFKRITRDEKEYLIRFYDFDRQYFKDNCDLPLNDGVVAKLEYKGIIARSSSVSREYLNFSYLLQPWALELINKKLDSGEIRIEIEKPARNANRFYMSPSDEPSEQVKYIWK